MISGYIWECNIRNYTQADHWKDKKSLYVTQFDLGYPENQYPWDSNNCHAKGMAHTLCSKSRTDYHGQTDCSRSPNEKIKHVIVLASIGSFRNSSEIRIWVKTRKSWQEIIVILSLILFEMEIQINQMNPSFYHSMNRITLFTSSYVYTKKLLGRKFRESGRVYSMAVR